MSADSSRKPSGSSTHSGAHSPSSSPNNVRPRSLQSPTCPTPLLQGQSQRKLNPSAAGSMYGVGIPNTNGLKGLNSGWQVRATRWFCPYLIYSLSLLGLGLCHPFVQEESVRVVRSQRERFVACSRGSKLSWKFGRELDSIEACKRHLG